MKIDGNLLKTMKINGKRWKPSDDKKPAWNSKSMKVCENQWKGPTLEHWEYSTSWHCFQKNLTSRAHQAKQFHTLLQTVWISTLAVPSLLLNRALLLAKLLRILTSRSLCHSSLWNCCILLMTISNCLTTTGLPIIWPAELTEETNAECIQTSIRRMPDGSAAEAVACK